MQAHNLRTFALVALIMAVGADDLEKYCLQPEELLEAEAEHLAMASSCAGEYFYAGIIQVAENSGDPGLDFEGMGLCEQLVALNVGTITFIGDAFMRQLFISAASHLSGDQGAQTAVAPPRPSPTQQNESVHEEILRVQDECAPAVLPLRYWPARSMDSVAITMTNNNISSQTGLGLTISNMAPGTTFESWRWTLVFAGGRPESMIHWFLPLPEQCRSWMHVRRYGSVTHLTATYCLLEREVLHARPTCLHTEGVSNAHINRHKPLCRNSQHTHGKWQGEIHHNNHYSST